MKAIILKPKADDVVVNGGVGLELPSQVSVWKMTPCPGYFVRGIHSLSFVSYKTCFVILYSNDKSTIHVDTGAYRLISSGLREAHVTPNPTYQCECELMSRLLGL